MSSEKEIVNYWYNKQGYFTINNIKTATNKDAGILALKLDNGTVNEVVHAEVLCSITSSIVDSKNPEKSIKEIIESKFEDRITIEAINEHIKQFSIHKSRIKKILITSSLPKSRKKELISEFNNEGVQVIEFENIIYDTLSNLDTRYYKNDVIRTLQLTKHLLLTHPDKLASLVLNDNLSPSSRKILLSSILRDDGMIREFRKTNSERLAAIIKNSKIKPKELAHIVEKDVLNKKTKRVFLNSLMEKENIMKIINKNLNTKPKITNKRDSSLEKFF